MRIVRIEVGSFACFGFQKHSVRYIAELAAGDPSDAAQKALSARANAAAVEGCADLVDQVKLYQGARQ